MQANLSWPQARVLAESGSIVRRKWWLARSLFNTAGDLFWIQWGSKRVALATDFTIADYNATDWTDAPPERAHCLQIALNGLITFASPSIVSGEGLAATLTTAEILDEDVTFTLSSDHPSITFPATVTIAQGSSSVNFAVTGSTTDSQSGIVTLTGTSTYIGAAGSISYSYIAPPPPPFPSMYFTMVRSTNVPPHNRFVSYPVGVITNGPCVATLIIKGNVADDVTFNGVIYQADQFPPPVTFVAVPYNDGVRGSDTNYGTLMMIPFDNHAPAGHRNGPHYFTYAVTLAPGEAISVGNVCNETSGGFGASAEIHFSDYNGYVIYTTVGAQV